MITLVAIVIEPLQNGPYLVKNLESLTNSKGAVLPTKGVLALCRCGHSTTKPFCSGMHKEIGFDSSRLGGGPPDRRDDDGGDGITIHDNRGICAHSPGTSRFCDGSRWDADFRDEAN